MLVFEVFGVVFAMLGAWYMSKGFAQKENAIKTFSLFLVSNVMFINMAIGAMLIPLMVQMLLFSVFGLMGVKTFAPELMGKVLTVFLVSLIPTLVNLYFSFGVSPNFEITGLEVIAASSAVLGSYLLRSPKSNDRLGAFALFIIADGIYIAIGIEYGLYFFAMQAAYFLYTSVVGIINTKKQSQNVIA